MPGPLQYYIEYHAILIHIMMAVNRIIENFIV